MNFLKNENGAVTIDWVVLTAGIIGLGLAVVLTVAVPVTEVGDQIENSVDAIDVSTY